MKKIAVVAVCDYRSQPNGGEVFLLNNFLSAHKNAEIEYHLIGMTFDEAVTEGKWTRIAINGKEYDFLPVAKVLKDKEKTHVPFRLRMVLGIYKYWNELSAGGFKEIYIHSAELGIPFWNKPEMQLIYHVHGDPSQTLKFSRFAFFRAKVWTDLYLSFIRKTIRKSKKVIWAAQRSKELYLAAQPAMQETVDEKSVVVHSSFDTKLVVNHTRLGSLKNRIHMVTVARLAAIKHIDFIIRSTADLVRQGYDVDLLVCGDGEEKKALQNLANELGVQDRILFLGLADRELIATALDQAQVFLFASENEAMSLVVLESLYMGTPAVSTNVGDIPQVVVAGQTGYIVDGYDETAYTESIQKILLAGKERYSDACRKMALRYTPDRMAEEIDRVLLHE
jgi:glycosyltransferase involved in cell wall biosynthesis